MSTAAENLSSQQVIELFDRYVVGNYTRYPACLVRGEGSEVWDADGVRYLDFFPGWGCNLIGHSPPRVVQAVQEQVAQLIHVPNTWYIEAQGQFAKALSDRSFGGKAFFCNSGAEANEAAIKLARAHQAPKYKIITAEKSFHGRTYAAVSATGQAAYQAGIGPLLPGFVHVPYGDINAIKQAIDDHTAAIMLEPVQGEGGVRIPDQAFLSDVRALCDEHELLLILDEVQTGMGRTGQWFAYQHTDIEPDILTVAKALAGGVACGAMLAQPAIAASLKPGMHASTFGGNPIACRAGLATIETIEEDGLLQRAAHVGEKCHEFFTSLAPEVGFIRDIRVLGCMIGVELNIPGTPILQECLRRRLLINCTQQTTLRLLPALNIPDEHLSEGLAILGDVLRSAEAI